MQSKVKNYIKWVALIVVFGIATGKSVLAAPDADYVDYSAYWSGYNTPTAENFRQDLQQSVQAYLDLAQGQHVEYYSHQRGLAGYSTVWGDPAGEIRTLCEVYDLLPDNLRTQVTDYVSGLILQYPLWDGSHAWVEGGVDRTYSGMIDAARSSIVSADQPYKAPAGNLYTLWLYAKVTGDWATIQNNWSSIVNIYNQSSNTTYDWMAGMIGFYRMAQHLADIDSGTYGTIAAQARTSAVNAVAAVRSDGYSNVYNRKFSESNVNSTHDWVYPPFHTYRSGDSRKLSTVFYAQEIGRLLRDFQASNVQSHINDHLSVGSLWAWYLHHGDTGRDGVNHSAPDFPSGQSQGGENSTFSPTMSWTWYLLHAYVIDAPTTDLRRYVDIPYAHGDLFYIEKLAGCIRRHGTVQWADYENPIPPAPSSSLSAWINVDPGSLNPSTTTGIDPTNGTFSIWNIGTGTLNYAISSNANWLSVSPVSGSSTGESDTITVDYHITGLTEGVYTAAVTVTAAAADNSPVSIPVVLTLTDPPAPSLNVSPATLDRVVKQGGTLSPDTFDVWVAATTTVSYTLSTNAGWLSVSPTSGTSMNEHDAIGVTYAVAGLAEGLHNASITVTAPNATNSPKSVSVSVSVDGTGPGILNLLPTSRNVLSLSFTEAISAMTATNPANYMISTGITVNAVSLGSDTQSVQLSVSTLTSEQPYTLSVSNVQDLVGNPVPAGTSSNFIFVAPSVTTVTAVADTRIRPVVPDTVYGSDTTIKCQGNDSAVLLRFDLSGLNATITGAVLTLTLDQSVGSSVGGSLYQLRDENGAWQESGATWNHLETPSTVWHSGGSFDSANDTYGSLVGSYSLSSGAAGSPLDIALSVPALESMRSNGVANLYMEGSSGTIYLRAKEYATAADRPQLTLSFAGSGGGGNQAPVADVAASPTSGTDPLTVSFDGSGSYDPDGSIASWDWTFGDGVSSNGATVSHEYAAVGVYTAELTVSDGTLTDTDTAVITVTSSSQPPQGGSVVAGSGQSVALSGSVNVSSMASAAAQEAKAAFLANGGTTAKVVMVLQNTGDGSGAVEAAIQAEFGTQVPIAGAGMGWQDYIPFAMEDFTESSDERSIAIMALGGDAFDVHIGWGDANYGADNYSNAVAGGEALADSLSPNINPAKKNLILIDGPLHGHLSRGLVEGIKNRLGDPLPSHVKITGWAGSFWGCQAYANGSLTANRAVGIMLVGDYQWAFSGVDHGELGWDGQGGGDPVVEIPKHVANITNELGSVPAATFFVIAHPPRDQFDEIRTAVEGVLGSGAPLIGQQGGAEFGHDSTAADGLADGSHFFVTGIIGTSGTNNYAPSVDAGANQSITLPTTQVSLDATVTDDGLPTNGTLSVQWTKDSGSGTVSFGSATAVDTTATFPTNDTYVLRLTATDGALTNSDTVTITVNAEPGPPTNTPPAVDAGSNQSISLPTSQVSLDGTVTDDGLPTNGTLSVQWTKDSGAGTVSFGNATSVDTTATFPTNDTYVLRLTATDGALTNSDIVTITVNPEPGPTVQTTLVAVADTRIRPAVPDSNYGSDTTMKCQSGDSEMLLRFDLSGIGNVITSAVLTLTLDQNVSGTLEGTAYRIHNQNDAWQESGATWNHRQTPATVWYGGGSFNVSADTYNTAIGSYSLSSGSAGSAFDIALDGATLEAMRTNGNAGIHLDPTTLNGLYVRSSEHATAADRPQLTLYCEAAQAPDPDGDGDGMDDSWEQQHFGNTSSANGNTDSDADGMLDWEEFVAGSQPTNAASRFMISNSQASGSGNVLQWDAKTGRYYNVYWSTSILDTPFSIYLSNVTVSSDGTLSVTDAVHSAEQRVYYRIDVRQ